MKLPEPKPVVKSEGAPANASADKASDGPMRRARAGEDRPGMTATQGTLKPHKKQNLNCRKQVCAAAV